MICFTIICSRSLEHTQVRETGLELLASAWSPFLKIGVILAVNHLSGIDPDETDLWKIIVRMGVNSSDNSLKTRGESSSGPMALWTLRPERSFLTPFSVTFIGGNSGNILSPRSGTDCRFSFVKTEQ